MQKNYAGLFCDKMEDIYKEVYNEGLPENWLKSLNNYTENIIIENLPELNKSILYYTKNVCLAKYIYYNLKIHFILIIILGREKTITR